MEPEILAIINSGMLHIAVKHISKSYGFRGDVMFSSSWPEINEEIHIPKFVIIESAAIPEPMEVNIAELVSKNSKSRVLIIENKKCPKDTSGFIFEKIKENDPKGVVRGKLNRFFRPEDSKQVNHDEVLSEREKDIVRLVAMGKTNKEISDNLFISPHTVITHRKNITAKLGIKTIAGLTVYSVLNGLINPDEVSE